MAHVHPYAITGGILILLFCFQLRLEFASMSEKSKGKL